MWRGYAFVDCRFCDEITDYIFLGDFGRAFDVEGRTCADMNVSLAVSREVKERAYCLRDKLVERSMLVSCLLCSISPTHQ
jgi:hypothetical protein